MEMERIVWAVTVSTRVLCVGGLRALYLKHLSCLFNNKKFSSDVGCLVHDEGLDCFSVRVHLYTFMHIGGAYPTMVTAESLLLQKITEESLKSLLEGVQEEWITWMKNQVLL